MGQLDPTLYLKAHKGLKNIEDYMKTVAESSLPDKKKREVYLYILKGLQEIRSKFNLS